MKEVEWPTFFLKMELTNGKKMTAKEKALIKELRKELEFAIEENCGLRNEIREAKKEERDLISEKIEMIRGRIAQQQLVYGDSILLQQIYGICNELLEKKNLG